MSSTAESNNPQVLSRRQVSIYHDIRTDKVTEDRPGGRLGVERDLIEMAPGACREAS